MTKKYSRHGFTRKRKNSNSYLSTLLDKIRVNQPDFDPKLISKITSKKHTPRGFMK